MHTQYVYQIIGESLYICLKYRMLWNMDFDNLAKFCNIFATSKGDKVLILLDFKIRNDAAPLKNSIQFS